MLMHPDHLLLVVGARLADERALAAAPAGTGAEPSPGAPRTRPARRRRWSAPGWALRPSPAAPCEDC